MAHHDLRTNRKLQRLCTSLKISEPLAVGLLEFFWWSVYDACGKSVGRDGFLADWSSIDVATSAKWHKNPDDFVGALCNAGFLKKRKRGFTVHHLAKWAPDYVKKRWDRAEQRQTVSAERRTTADNGSLRNGTEPNRKERNGTEPGPVESLRIVESVGNPRQTRAGPELNSTNSAGSGREERAQRDKFRSLFAAKVCVALGLNGAAAQRQRRSLYAVARRIYVRPNYKALANRFVAIAAEKRDAGLDKPIAAWQKEVNEVLRS